MEIDHAIDFLILTTCRIEGLNEQGEVCSTGSGYFFDFSEEEGQICPFIVTNQHVIDGVEYMSIYVTLDKSNTHEYVVLDLKTRGIIPHPKGVDLVAIPIGDVVNHFQEKDMRIRLGFLDMSWLVDSKLLESISAMEDVVMIGYPNGLWDEKNNFPLIRKGVTATHPKRKLNGKNEFLADIAAFPGSSGSPVFLAQIGTYKSGESLMKGDRVRLLGTLYAGPYHTATGKIVMQKIATRPEPIAVSPIPNNLGLIINTEELNVLSRAVLEKIENLPEV